MRTQFKRGEDVVCFQESIGLTFIESVRRQLAGGRDKTRQVVFMTPWRPVSQAVGRQSPDKGDIIRNRPSVRFLMDFLQE